MDSFRVGFMGCSLLSNALKTKLKPENFFKVNSWVLAIPHENYFPIFQFWHFFMVFFHGILPWVFMAFCWQFFWIFMALRKLMVFGPHDFFCYSWDFHGFSWGISLAKTMTISWAISWDWCAVVVTGIQEVQLRNKWHSPGKCCCTHHIIIIIMLPIDILRHKDLCSDLDSHNLVPVMHIHATWCWLWQNAWKHALFYTAHQ